MAEISNSSYNVWYCNASRCGRWTRKRWPIDTLFPARIWYDIQGIGSRNHLLQPYRLQQRISPIRINGAQPQVHCFHHGRRFLWIQVVAFGLKIAPAHFQRAIDCDSILGSCRFEFALAFISAGRRNLQEVRGVQCSNCYKARCRKLYLLRRQDGTSKRIVHDNIPTWIIYLTLETNRSHQSGLS